MTAYQQVYETYINAHRRLRCLYKPGKLESHGKIHALEVCMSRVGIGLLYAQRQKQEILPSLEPS